MLVIMNILTSVSRTKSWWVISAVLMMTAVEVAGLNGPNVCMVQQKYNITKRVKYRAPVSVRSYVWCLAVPPRCSQWKTEMRDLTRLETEERTAEMAVCCPGYKMRDVSCVPICPSGKTGLGCSEDCPPKKWGPNCVHECKKCVHGRCSPTTGRCLCQEGWQGESCESSMATTQAADVLTTTKAPKVIPITTPLYVSTRPPTTTSESTTKATTSMIVTTTVTNIKDATFAMSTPSMKSVKTTTSNKILMSPRTTSTKMSQEVTQEVSLAATEVKKSTYDNVTLAQKSLKNTFTTGATENLSVQDELNLYTTISTTKTVDPTNFLTAKITPFSTLNPTTSTGVTSTNQTTHFTNVKTSSVVKEATTQTAINVKEITKRPDPIVIKSTTTVKFKPKEIWIKTAQKGDSSTIETKIKHLDIPKARSPPKKESTSEVTTPKTIIVSIIPTSVSYVTFKKLSLTTASSTNKSPVSARSNRSTVDYTKLMAQVTATTPIKVTGPKRMVAMSTLTPAYQIVTKTKETAKIVHKTTNSMTSTLNDVNEALNSSNTLTTVYFPSSNVMPTRKPITETRYFGGINTTSATKTEGTKTMTTKDIDIQVKTTAKQLFPTNEYKRNVTNTKTNTVTDDPNKGEETFHILTEPEHITAVMGDKRNERTSVDLISVISIAGGVMMAIITVAVVIVMLERCRKPRYEDVGKFNDITMQVMIDNNDVPPPYVRSIFHTPLPAPPTSEKCHYQPISTLDRNIKQFMRPVVVQTISPLMLENFRGILECHYDHLPRRSHEFEIGTRGYEAPPIGERQELLSQRASSVTESTIEALKCEAKFDVIDTTTSEPLYAEIPCWRPPSEHAVEINNLNGEAVTEL